MARVGADPGRSHVAVLLGQSRRPRWRSWSQRSNPWWRGSGPQVSAGPSSMPSCSCTCGARRYVVSDEMLEYGRAYVAAQREVGDPGESGVAHFMNGFAHLWHGDLDTAEEELQSALGLATRTGDVTTQARCLTYLTVTARKRGLTDRVRHLAAQSLSAAAAAHMPEYTATAHANLAWADWRDARPDECEAMACEALDEWRDLPAGHASAAFQWTALWPLIGVCLGEGRVAEAVDHSTRAPRSRAHADARRDRGRSARRARVLGARRTAEDDAAPGWSGRRGATYRMALTGRPPCSSTSASSSPRNTPSAISPQKTATRRESDHSCCGSRTTGASTS